jgi:hypothetical protein
MEIDFEKVYEQSRWHAEAIRNSRNCGCFHCLSIFKPNEIIDWIDEPENCPKDGGRTAICPNCGVDSVLPDSIDYDLTKNFLEIMQAVFFG